MEENRTRELFNVTVDTTPEDLWAHDYRDRRSGQPEGTVFRFTHLFERQNDRERATERKWGTSLSTGSFLKRLQLPRIGQARPGAWAAAGARDHRLLSAQAH